MTAIERAEQYAALFTHMTEQGKNWRMCVPIDSKPHRSRDEMLVDGVRIAKAEDGPAWAVVA